MIFLDIFTKDSFISAVSSFSTKLKECCNDSTFLALYKKRLMGHMMAVITVLQRLTSYQQCNSMK